MKTLIAAAAAAAFSISLATAATAGDWAGNFKTLDTDGNGRSATEWEARRCRSLSSIRLRPLRRWTRT